MIGGSRISSRGYREHNAAREKHCWKKVSEGSIKELIEALRKSPDGLSAMDIKAIYNSNITNVLCLLNARGVPVYEDGPKSTRRYCLLEGWMTE
jgi:hypothetical protein